MCHKDRIKPKNTHTHTPPNAINVKRKIFCSSGFQLCYTLHVSTNRSKDFKCRYRIIYTYHTLCVGSTNIRWMKFIKTNWANEQTKERENGWSEMWNTFRRRSYSLLKRTIAVFWLIGVADYLTFFFFSFTK